MKKRKVNLTSIQDKLSKRMSKKTIRGVKQAYEKLEKHKKVSKQSLDEKELVGIAWLVYHGLVTFKNHEKTVSYELAEGTVW